MNSVNTDINGRSINVNITRTFWLGLLLFWKKDFYDLVTPTTGDEINSHEINCRKVNSHETNLSQDQLSCDQLVTLMFHFIGQEHHGTNTKSFYHVELGNCYRQISSNFLIWLLGYLIQCRKCKLQNVEEIQNPLHIHLKWTPSDIRNKRLKNQ